MLPIREGISFAAYLDQFGATPTPGSVVNASVSSNADIDLSKLQDIQAGEIVVGNGVNGAKAVMPTGDVQVSSDGELKVGLLVKNTTGNTINPGTPVAPVINGDGTVGVALADNADVKSVVYHTREAIVNNTTGFVYQASLVESLNTAAASAVGAPVYLGVNGALIFDTPPTDSLKAAVRVGYVKVKDGAVGKIQFHPPVVEKVPAAALSMPEGSTLVGGPTGVAASKQLQGDMVVDKDGKMSLSRQVTNTTPNNWQPGALLNVSVNADGTVGVVAADDISNIPATHVATALIAALGGTGTVVQNFELTGIDTSTAAAVQSDVFLSAAGNYVFDTPNAGGTRLAQPVGQVTVKDASVGKIQFHLPGTGAIDQGLQLSTTFLKDDSVANAKILSVSETKSNLLVSNKTGVALSEMALVHVQANADGSFGAALADAATNKAATHIVTQPAGIADTASGTVAKLATYGSLNTSAAVGVNSPVYLDAAGGYKFDTAPVGADAIGQVIGYVLVKDAAVGIIAFVVNPVSQHGTSGLKDAAVTATKFGATVGATLAAAPTFTGGSDTTSADSAGTSSGTAAAQTFTGNALGTHQHSLAYLEKTALALTERRLYTGAVTGTPVIGATLLQAGSAATANVVSLGAGYLVINTIVGTFDATNVVTGTNPDLSTFTFTPPKTLIAAFTPAFTFCAFAAAESNSGQSLTSRLTGSVLNTNQIQPSVDFLSLETLDSDGWTSISFSYVAASVSAASAGTPSGSNGTSAVSVTADGTHSHTVTPTGSNDAPAITVTVS